MILNVEPGGWRPQKRDAGEARGPRRVRGSSATTPPSRPASAATAARSTHGHDRGADGLRLAAAPRRRGRGPPARSSPPGRPRRRVVERALEPGEADLRVRRDARGAQLLAALGPGSGRARRRCPAATSASVGVRRALGARGPGPCRRGPGASARAGRRVVRVSSSPSRRPGKRGARRQATPRLVAVAATGSVDGGAHGAEDARARR